MPSSGSASRTTSRRLTSRSGMVSVAVACGATPPPRAPALSSPLLLLFRPPHRGRGGGLPHRRDREPVQRKAVAPAQRQHNRRQRERRGRAGEHRQGYQVPGGQPGQPQPGVGAGEDGGLPGGEPGHDLVGPLDVCGDPGRLGPGLTIGRAQPGRLRVGRRGRPSRPAPHQARRRRTGSPTHGPGSTRQDSARCP